MSDIKAIANSIVKQVKFLVEVLELNGFKTTENSLKSSDIDIEMYADIREAFNAWTELVNDLSLPERILESKYLNNALKGTMGYDYTFKREPGSKLGTLIFENKFRGNCYEIKIHPYGNNKDAIKKS